MKKKIIYLAKNGIKPLIKGQVIMRCGNDMGENIDYPIAYLRKAKNCSQKEYDMILNYLFKYANR